MHPVKFRYHMVKFRLHFMNFDNNTFRLMKLVFHVMNVGNNTSCCRILGNGGDGDLIGDVPNGGDLLSPALSE